VVDQGFLDGGFRFRWSSGTCCCIVPGKDGGSTLALVMKNIVEALYVYAEVVKQSVEKVLEPTISEIASASFSGHVQA